MTKGVKGVMLLAMISTAEACGTHATPPAPDAIDVSVTPSTAMIHVNSSVDFQANGSFLVKYTNLYWTVQGEGLACTTESLPPAPPDFPCPSGWVWEPIPIGELPRITATYYSPATAGTYQVVANVETPSEQTSTIVSTVTVVP